MLELPRIEQRLDGRPTLIIIEEAWAPLMRSVFAQRVRQWLMALRKENAAVLLVAHGASQLLDVSGGVLLAEACPTRVFLPNADATVAAYGALGLGERECARLARAVPKRDYYMVTPRGYTNKYTWDGATLPGQRPGHSLNLAPQTPAEE